MKATTIDTIYNKMTAAFLWLQVIGAVLVTLFGIAYAVMNIVRGAGAFYVVAFFAIAVVGYKLMLQPSVAELKDARKKS